MIHHSFELRLLSPVWRNHFFISMMIHLNAMWGLIVKTYNQIHGNIKCSVIIYSLLSSITMWRYFSVTVWRWVFDGCCFGSFEIDNTNLWCLSFPKLPRPLRVVINAEQTKNEFLSSLAILRSIMIKSELYKFFFYFCFVTQLEKDDGVQRRDGIRKSN